MNISVPPVKEDILEWEGIGQWDETSDTVEMNSIQGRVLAVSEDSIKSGGIIWRLESVEELSSGIARSWPGGNDKWIAIRLMLINEDYNRQFSGETSALQETINITAAAARSHEIILREKVVLIDSIGTRHSPIKLHNKIEPSIDRPIRVETYPVHIILIYAMNRDAVPEKIELYDPLLIGKINITEPGQYPEWNVINKKMIFSDRNKTALWEITLSGTKLNVSDSSTFYTAKINFRNITGESMQVPDPSSLRLYAGSGKTFYSNSLSLSKSIAPGKSMVVEVKFINVPLYESLDLIIPYRDNEIAINCDNGYFAEKPFPMKPPVFSERLRITLYRAVKKENEFRIRAGFTYFGEDELNLTGIQAKAVTNNVTSIGVIENTPVKLHPNFEERRWIVFPDKPSSLEINIPERKTITIKL